MKYNFYLYFLISHLMKGKTWPPLSLFYPLLSAAALCLRLPSRSPAMWNNLRSECENENENNEYDKVYRNNILFNIWEYCWSDKHIFDGQSAPILAKWMLDVRLCNNFHLFLCFSFQSSNSTFDLSFQLFQNTFETFNRKFKDALHNHSVKARTENFWNLQSQIQMCVA